MEKTVVVGIRLSLSKIDDLKASSNSDDTVWFIRGLIDQFIEGHINLLFLKVRFSNMTFKNCENLMQIFLYLDLKKSKIWDYDFVI